MVFAYLLYILSGVVKALLTHFRIELPVDFTIVTALLLIFAIFFDVVNHGIKLKTQKRLLITNILLFLFYLWIILSLVYTPSLEYSKIKTFYFLTNIIAFIYPIIIKNFDFQKFIKYFSITLIGVSAFFVVNFQAIRLRSHADDTSVDGQYLTLSTFLGIITLILLTSESNIFKNKIIDRIVAILAFFLILLLGARGPLIFMLFAYFLYFLNNLTRKREKSVKKKHLLYSIITFFVFTFISIGIYQSNKEKIDIMAQRTYSRFEIMITNDESQNSSVTKRVEQLQYSFDEIFSDMQSFFAGKGIGSFSLLYHGEDGRGYPHNIFVEIWFELGLIGLIIFLSFFVFLLSRKQVNKIISHFVLLYILLNMAKSSSLVDLRIYFGFFALFLLSDIKKLKKPELNNKIESLERKK